MWIISNNGVLNVISNSPADKVAKFLKKGNPGATVLRSLEPSYEAFAALAYATKEVLGDPTTEMRPTGDIDPATDESIMEEVEVPGQLSTVTVGNTFGLDDTDLVVRDPDGAELARFALEVVE